MGNQGKGLFGILLIPARKPPDAKAGKKQIERKSQLTGMSKETIDSIISCVKLGQSETRWY
jgi:hypothetical protein